MTSGEPCMLNVSRPVWSKLLLVRGLERPFFSLVAVRGLEFVRWAYTWLRCDIPRLKGPGSAQMLQPRWCVLDMSTMRVSKPCPLFSSRFRFDKTPFSSSQHLSFCLLLLVLFYNIPSQVHPSRPSATSVTPVCTQTEYWDLVIEQAVHNKKLN